MAKVSTRTRIDSSVYWREGFRPAQCPYTASADDVLGTLFIYGAVACFIRLSTGAYVAIATKAIETR